MSFVSKEKTAPATWKVAAHIEAADFRGQLDATFAKELKKVSLPGFRPGKAPRAMVEKRYGEKVFFDDALEALLPAAVKAALEEAELELQFPAEGLDVPPDQDWKENGIGFTFTAAAKPEVALGAYKGVEVEAPSPAVTDADVDARILELQHRNARRVEVESRPAQDGDIALIDFLGRLDGEPFDGGAGQNYELTLGSGQFIPGFEEQVIGHAPGESFEVGGTFPEECQAERLAGKPVVFEVTLHELKAEELPEVDDDFAQEVGEDYDNVADLRAGIGQELAESKAKQSEEAFDRAVQDKLAEMLEGEIPPAMFDRRTQQNVEMFLERIQMPLERYLEIIGEDPAAFDARMREQSTAQVKIELALQKVAELEGFEPGGEEIEAEYHRLAGQYKVPLARVKYAVPREDIVNDLNRGRALALVKGEAVKTEV
ncbi:MAG: trigger factor [Oscillospiraceae bacterium]|jgi:trigger factor|nr:trigger factor [Oscillospiraceae bacterium]